jgi:isocitrate lyase
MAVEYDGSELCQIADEKIRTFQVDDTRDAGIFHHLIILLTSHTKALYLNDLTEDYFGEDGILAYVKEVQR